MLDRAANLPPTLLLALGLLTFLGLSYVPLVDDTSIVDEPIHLYAGSRYLAASDFTVNPEHPPLSKILAAGALLPLHVTLPPPTQLYPTYVFLYRSGNDADRLLFWGRVPTLLWGLVLIASVFLVSRSLYGARGGFISLVLIVFCPTVLAHSHLVTSDVIVTATMFLAVVTFWKLLDSPSLQRSIGAGLLVGAAVATNFKAALLVLILPILALICLVRSRRDAAAWIPGAEPSPLGSLWRRAARLSGYLAVVLLVAYAILWASYGFRYKSSPDPTFEFDWTVFKLSQGSVIERTTQVARRHRLLPEAYLYGFLFNYEHLFGHPAYALGRYSARGWWWYFPFAFLVKNPVPFVILSLWGLWAWLRRARRDPMDSYGLIVPIALYWAFAMSSHLNIGVRHMLPVYPFMATLAGGIGLGPEDARTRRFQHLVVDALLSVTAIGCVAAAPYFLAYFNAPSLLFFDRHYMLVDSNLDWGQDLRRLKRWMDRQGIEEIKLSYFGVASPEHLNLRHQLLPRGNPHQIYEKQWKHTDEFLPGDVVAISATYLASPFDEDKGYYLRRFGRLKPIAVIGHSILVYRIPAPEHTRDSPGAQGHGATVSDLM